MLHFKYHRNQLYIYHNNEMQLYYIMKIYLRINYIYFIKFDNNNLVF